MAKVVTEIRECVWGDGYYESARFHTEVFTADDNEHDFDHRVLGPTPNGYQFGYCSRCRQPMRWSVPRQRWVDWDPKAPLPEEEPTPPHPHHLDCTGVAATFCDIHGYCICGKCCLMGVRVEIVEPVLTLVLTGAIVEVGLRCLTSFDLSDPHCPLHGLPWSYGCPQPPERCSHDPGGCDLCSVPWSEPLAGPKYVLIDGGTETPPAGAVFTLGDAIDGCYPETTEADDLDWPE